MRFNSKKFNFPLKCPSCGSKTIKDFNSTTKKEDAVRRCSSEGYECKKMSIEKRNFATSGIVEAKLSEETKALSQKSQYHPDSIDRVQLSFKAWQTGISLAKALFSVT